MPYGRISKIDKDLTTIITDDYEVVQVNSLFLPLKLKKGDYVELQDNRIVMKWDNEY
jgi:hypothetical protein